MSAGTYDLPRGHRLELRAMSEDFGLSVKLALYEVDEHGDRIRVFQFPTESTPMKPFDLTPHPTLELHQGTAQNLADSLWNAGIRPQPMGERVQKLEAELETLTRRLKELEQTEVPALKAGIAGNHTSLERIELRVVELEATTP